MAPPSKAKPHKQTQGTKVSQKKRSDSETITSKSSGYLPSEVQQIILNTFATAFPIVEDVDSLRQTIQEVKGHLFKRDFPAAFGQESYLQAYAVRWSAARALGYSHILARVTKDYLHNKNPAALSSKISEVGSHPTLIDQGANLETVPQSPPQRVICIGGGAGAEIIALAACRRYIHFPFSIQIIATDNANWDQPVKQLSSALTSPPRMPAHASEAAKAKPENQPLLEDSSEISVSFLHQDVLHWAHQDMSTTLANTILCTIMFTLNELFSASLPRTTSFLLALTDLMSVGSLLLVVDSPGSYSEIQVGKEKQSSDKPVLPNTKRYPMKWLLDHTLLDVAGRDNNAKWEKVESEDSLWFRIEQKEKLRYPVELENMRYQLHLYRRM